MHMKGLYPNQTLTVIEYIKNQALIFPVKNVYPDDPTDMLSLDSEMAT